MTTGIVTDESVARRIRSTSLPSPAAIVGGHRTILGAICDGQLHTRRAADAESVARLSVSRQPVGQAAVAEAAEVHQRSRPRGLMVAPLDRDFGRSTVRLERPLAAALAAQPSADGLARGGG